MCRDKVFKYVILLLALSCLLYSQVNTGGSGLLMPNNLAVWFLAGVIILVSGFRVLKSHEWRVVPFATRFSVAILLVLLFSLVNSSASQNEVLLFSCAFIGTILFFYALFQWRIKHTTFLKILVFLCVVGLLHALVGTVQIHDPFRVWYTITGYLPFGIATNRPVGVIQQVNMTATLMATVVVASFYIVSHASFQKYKRTWQAAVFLSAFFSFYILLLSGSRAGWLAFVVSFILVFFARYQGAKTYPKVFFIWVGCLFFAGLMAYWLPGETASAGMLADKFYKIGMGADVRLYLYSYSFQLFLTSPWLGFGLEGYTPAFVEYVQAHGDASVFGSLKLTEFLHPHNEVLYWMLQSGVVALLAVLWLAVIYLKKLFKQRALFALGVLGLMMPILIQTQLSSPFSFSALHLFLLLFLLHYGVRNDKKIRSFDLSAQSRYAGNFLLTGLLIIWIWAAWWSVKSIQDAYEFEYRLFLTAKQTPKEIEEMRYFEFASLHPAFADSVHTVMNKTLERSLGNGNRYDIKRFIWWAEDKEPSERSLLTTVNLIKAYRFMGQDGQADQVYKKALDLFPGAAELKSLNKAA